MKIIKYLCFLLSFGSTLSLFSAKQSDSAVQALYHSIPESDIVKLFAFYELYPHTQAGKSALHTAWRNLQMHRTEIIPINDCINLPNIDIDTMIQALLEPAKIKTNFLNTEQIELLEKISDHLMNRQLKGYTVWTKEDIKHLEAQEIDLSRAILLHELDDRNKIRQYEVFLDFITLQILAKLPSSPTPVDKIYALNHWIFYEMQFRFPPHSLWPKDIDAYTLLAQVIDNRQGVCLGVSILYLCLAQRLGVSLQIFTPPGHIFISYSDETQTINIETTARGRNIPTREYLSSNVRFLRERSIKEIIGLVFINQGAKFLHLQDYSKAAEFYDKAIFYLPNDSTVKELLGFTLLFTKTREEEAIQLLLSTRDTSNPGMIYPSSISKDYLENRINLEGIKILWLPVRETRESIIKKNRELQSLIEKFPLTREGLFHLAISYLQLSNTVEAEKVLLKYVKVNPEHPTAHYYLSILAKKHMNLAEAWKHYKIAESIIKRAGGNLYCLRDLREQLQSLLPETAIMPIKNIDHKEIEAAPHVLERVGVSVPLKDKEPH